MLLPLVRNSTGHHSVTPLPPSGLTRLALVPLCLVALLSCATITNQPTTAPVWLTNQKSIQILPVAALGQTLERRQQIVGDFQGQTLVMDALIEATTDHFSLIVLNSFGNQIFDLEYDSQGIRCDSPLPLGKIKPEYLMADWQLCYFPRAAVATMLHDSGLRLVESDSGDNRRRTVYDGDQLIIDISRDGSGVLHYRNLLRGYAYTITEGN